MHALGTGGIPAAGGALGCYEISLHVKMHCAAGGGFILTLDQKRFVSTLAPPRARAHSPPPALPSRHTLRSAPPP